MSSQAEETRKGKGPTEAKGGQTSQFATFYLDGELFGIEILKVQEILMEQRLTPVPLSYDFISGLISLRGQIVTALDLKRRLGMSQQKTANYPYNIVVRAGDMFASFQVENIGEVLEVAKDKVEPPPDTLKGIDSRYLEGVYPLKNEILSILNVDNILEIA